MTNISTQAPTAAEEASAAAILEELTLDDLDLSGLEDLVIADLDNGGEDLVIEADTVTDEEALAIETAVVMQEHYADQETSAELDDTPPAEVKPVAAPGKKVRVKAASRTKSEPRVARTVDDLPATCFVLTDDQEADDANKATVLASKPTQKKIAEKFDNLLTAIAAGKAPSTYVTDCFAVLNARKTVTGSDLVAALQEHDYTIGTARSQAGQVMVLFDVLKVATRNGQTLTLNEKSTIARALARDAPAA